MRTHVDSRTKSSSHTMFGMQVINNGKYNNLDLQLADYILPILKRVNSFTCDFYWQWLLDPIFLKIYKQ
jgi:hypothetical protein